MLIIILVLILALALGATIYWNYWRFEQAIAQEVQQMLQQAQSSDALIRHDDLDHLPAPVQRYIRHCVPDGHPVAYTVRLQQTGAMSLSPGADWKPFRATQHFTSQPPGFVWQARLQFLPLIWVKARDIYHRQRGNMRVKILSTVTVADARGANTTSGAFVRFLLEMMWFPSAMVYHEDVTWHERDDHHAGITLRDGDLEVDAVFTFNDEGDIIRAESEHRYRNDEDTQPTPWYGICEAYGTFNGVRIPKTVTVCWGLPEGEYPYWRGTITQLETNIQ